MHLGQDAAIRAVMGRLPRFAWLLSSCLLCLPSNAAAQTRPPAGGSAEAPRKPAPTKARQPAKPKKPRSARTVKAQKGNNGSRTINKREPKRPTKARPDPNTPPPPPPEPPKAAKPKRVIAYKDEPLTAEEQRLTDALSLELNISGPRALWELHLQNVGDEPIAVLQDPRLFWLEVKHPGRARPIDCKLPKALTPRVGVHTERTTLLPNASIALRIDPQFYCYEEGAQTTLVPGAQVTVHYGFPSDSKFVWDKGKLRRLRLKQKGPYAFTPPERTSDGLKEITATPIALGAEYAAWSKAEEKRLDKDGRLGDLELLLSKGSDSTSPLTAAVEVTVRNRSQFRQRLHLRRELLNFVITGPEGEKRCEADAAIRAIDEQNLTSIGPGQRVSMTVRLYEFCPSDAFPRDGFYYVTASLPVFTPDALEARARSAEAGDQSVDVPLLNATAPRPLRILGTDGKFLHWEPAPDVIGVVAATAAPPSSP